ncbi:unnamed protein product [Symbiodinium sp. CCMP2592]|nr:unnamed protein product [Symbiodinium sp. CCMP2592]
MGAAELLWEEQAVTAQFDACLRQQVLPNTCSALEDLSLRPASRRKQWESGVRFRMVSEILRSATFVVPKSGMPG